MNIIGVTGQAGVGKDTFAEYMVMKHRFARIALADPMKRIAREVWDFSPKQLWGPSSERNKPDSRYEREDGTFLSPRIALQVMGTEMGRTCYKNTWVDLCIRDAKKLLEPHRTHSTAYTPEYGVSERLGMYMPVAGVVVPDCRFYNEIEAIHQAGGKVIRLRRETAADALKVGVLNHASEKEQQSIPDGAFDLTIDCADGVLSFYDQLDTIIPALLAGMRSRS
jgi:hypothetical protein